MGKKRWAGDNDDKNEPTKLKKPDPGKSPQPPNCSCVWTALDYGWVKGADRPDCDVHGDG